MAPTYRSTKSRGGRRSSTEGRADRLIFQILSALDNVLALVAIAIFVVMVITIVAAIVWAVRVEESATTGALSVQDGEGLNGGGGLLPSAQSES